LSCAVAAMDGLVFKLKADSKKKDEEKEQETIKRKERKEKFADSRQTKKDNFYKECRSHLEENK